MNLSLTITGSREELAHVLSILQGAQVDQLQVETGPAQPPAQQAPAQQTPVTPVQPPAQAPTTPVAAHVTPPAAPATPPTAPVAQTALTTAPAAPTSAPQYDFNQIATATMQLQEAGHNLYEIWAPFGIQALNQLPKERYAEYAAALRQRGAKI